MKKNKKKQQQQQQEDKREKVKEDGDGVVDLSDYDEDDLLKCRIILWHALSIDILEKESKHAKQQQQQQGDTEEGGTRDSSSPPNEIPGQLKAKCDDGILYDMISTSSPTTKDDGDVEIVDDEDELIDMYFNGIPPTYGLTEITISKQSIVTTTRTTTTTTSSTATATTPPRISTKRRIDTDEETSTDDQEVPTKSASTPRPPSIPTIDLSTTPIINQTLQKYDTPDIGKRRVGAASFTKSDDVTSGTYTVAVIRVTTGDGAPSASAEQLSDDIFGTYSDVYNLVCCCHVFSYFFSSIYF